MTKVHLEDSNDDAGAGPYVAGLDDLWLYWSSAPADLTGRALRRVLFASFASALQSRWLHGGYWFRFGEQARVTGATIADDAVHATLRAMFRRLPDGPLGLTWRAPLAALDDFLDRWLFFRRHRPYVCQDDVPDWMVPALREPWAACIRELVGDAAGARAAVLDGENLGDDWGDHGVTLVLAAGTRLSVVHVGLWTD